MTVSRVGQFIEWVCPKCNRSSMLRYVDARNSMSGKKLHCPGSQYSKKNSQEPACVNWIYVDELLRAVDGEAGTAGRPVDRRGQAMPVGDRD